MNTVLTKQRLGLIQHRLHTGSVGPIVRARDHRTDIASLPEISPNAWVRFATAVTGPPPAGLKLAATCTTFTAILRFASLYQPQHTHFTH